MACASECAEQLLFQWFVRQDVEDELVENGWHAVSVAANRYNWEGEGRRLLSEVAELVGVLSEKRRIHD